MDIGNIKQYRIGGTINESEFRELKNQGKIDKNIQFEQYDTDRDGRIEQKEVNQIEGFRAVNGTEQSRNGGQVDIVQQGKFGDVKTLEIGEGTHYVIIHTSHGNNEDADIGSITGDGVTTVSESGNGDNGIIIAKVTGPTSVQIDSSNAGAAQYAVVEGGGDITVFGGDDAGYPMDGDWTEVDVGGDAFFITDGHVDTPRFFSTERNREHGNTVTAKS